MTLSQLTTSEWQAVMLSLRVAGVCVAATLVPAIAMAWLLARRRFVGKTLLDAVVHLPLVLPPVVVGYLLLLGLGRSGLNAGIAFTWYGAVVASAVMGFPLMVRAVRLSIEAVDMRVENAAATLGASPGRVFMTVTLPLALPGVMTGMLLAFARSIGEFGATIMLAGNIPGRTQTLPLAIYTHAQMPDGDAAAMRLLIIAVLLSLIAMFVSQWLTQRTRRKIGGDA